MLTIAAVRVSTASAWLTSRTPSEIPSAMPSGSITPTRMIRSRSIAFSSGERGWRKALAVAASFAARLSAPTAVASKSPSPSTAKEPERTGSPVAADHRLGLAGQVRLVDRQTLGPREVAVGDDLVAALDPHQVADHDLADRDLARLAVADHRRRRGDQRRQLVERPLRPHLLEGADEGVGDEDAEEERVLGVAEDDRRGAEGGEDRVEDRERVGDRDRARRSGWSPPSRAGRARAAGARPRPGSGPAAARRACSSGEIYCRAAVATRIRRTRSGSYLTCQCVKRRRVNPAAVWVWSRSASLAWAAGVRW